MMTSGIFGTLVSVDGDTARVEVADGVVIEVAPAAVASVEQTTPAEPQGTDDAPEDALTMARTTPASRAGRTLVVFFLAIGVIFGLVALAGSWKPELGPRPAGRHPDHPDRQGRTTPRPTSRRRARSSTSASTAPASPRPR